MSEASLILFLPCCDGGRGVGSSSSGPLLLLLLLLLGQLQGFTRRVSVSRV